MTAAYVNLDTIFRATGSSSVPPVAYGDQINDNFTALANAVEMFGVGTPLVGGTPALGSPKYLIQGGSEGSGGSLVTNSLGGAGFNWPTPFPNGLLVALLLPGDSNVPCTAVVPTATSTNAGGTNFIAYNGSTPCNTVTIRVNYFAIGF